MVNNTLGRGLNSLIPQSAKSAPVASDATAQQDSTIVKDININELAYVVVDKIIKNPYQPRMEFNHEELEQLSESIKRYGILEPLVVTREGELLQLIAGERRLQAAILAGLERVPVIIREANKLEMLEISLIENIQRSDLNPLEEAFAYQRLIEEFKLTQE
ncbi:MAG: chromosome partitioning protein ParB, partial [Candidatus Komeilibacteria bacterium CG_4_9_14_0_8_um_filter_36_9]